MRVRVEPERVLTKNWRDMARMEGKKKINQPNQGNRNGIRKVNEREKKRRKRKLK